MPTPNSPPGLALKLSPQNPSASPVLEVAPLSPIGNFPIAIEKFPMRQSSFKSCATSLYREFLYAEFPHSEIPPEESGASLGYCSTGASLVLEVALLL